MKITKSALLAMTIAILSDSSARAQPAGQVPPHGTGLQLLDPAAYQALPEAVTPLGGQLPAFFDLSPAFQGFVGDQGGQSSCVGWALSYCVAYQEAQERLWSPVAPDHLFSVDFA